MSNAYEPICQGRNQLIIVADPRVAEKVYSNRRMLDVVQTTGEAREISITVETVNFIANRYSSNAFTFGVQTLFMSAIIALMTIF
jgi:hypothetical protein